MNKLVLKTTMLSLAALATISFSACSSSSGGGNKNDLSEVVYSGKAVDGYLVYATVCLDLTKDGYCQIGTEPVASTDTEGAFTLPALTAEQIATYPKYAEAPLLVYSGYDKDTGTDFIGKLKAPVGSGAINVTPLSTAVEAVMKSGSGKTKAEAETAVRKMLGLANNADLGADPVAQAGSDSSLLKAALKLQKTIEILMEAKKEAGATGVSDNNLMEELYTSIAANVDQNLSKALEAVVKDDDQLSDKALQSATAISGQIEILIGENGVANTAVIGTKIGAVKKEIVVAIENNATIPTKERFSEVTDKSFSLLHAEELLRITNIADDAAGTLAKAVEKVLKDGDMPENSLLPLETEITLLQADPATKAVGDKLEELQNNHKTAVETIKDGVENADKLTTLIDVNKLKADVNVLVDSPKAGADVDDAKNMFNQLRESAMTFASDDESTGELNVSTILGTQEDAIDKHIEPALEAIGSDLNITTNALDASVEAFGDDLNASFDGVMQSINDRLSAINDFADTKEDNETWTKTLSNGDSWAHTYTKDSSGNKTETFSLNNQTITVVSESSNDTNELKSISTNGAIALKGDGYDLSLSTLSLSNSQVSLKASGSITGANGAEMTLNALDMTIGINPENENISNPSIKFDGIISANSRSLEGSLLVTNKSITLEGNYTGANGEPRFNGKIITTLDLAGLLNDENSNAFDTSWVDSYSPLIMATVDDTKGFVYAYSEKDYSSIYDTNTSRYIGNKSSYEMYVQGVQDPITCTIENRRLYKGSNDYSIGNQNIVECENNTTLELYYGSDKQIFVTIDGKEELVRDTWNGYRGLNIQLESDNIHSVYSSGNTLKSWTDSGERNVSITKVRYGVLKDPFDRDLSLSVEGTLTHGSKVINAKVGLQNTGTLVKLYASNLELNDGTNFAKVAELSIAVAKKVVLSELVNDHGYSTGQSRFENYTYYYNYQDNESNDEFEDLKSVKLLGAKISITDATGETLNVDADVRVLNADTIQVVFDGKYTYRNSVFEGHIDTDFRELKREETYQCGPSIEDVCTSTYSELLGTLNIKGTIEANGFMPFGITATATSRVQDEGDVYGLFTRGDTYKLGFHAVSKYDKSTDTETTSIKITDSNGVIGTQESTNKVLNVTNSAGTSLATYGEDETGNDWEIKYSDDSTETLF